MTTQRTESLKDLVLAQCLNQRLERQYKLSKAEPSYANMFHVGVAERDYVEASLANSTKLNQFKQHYYNSVLEVVRELKGGNKQDCMAMTDEIVRGTDSIINRYRPREV